MIDSLPDPILLELLALVPQLGFVNRRLFGLAELLARNRLLCYFDYNDQQIDALAADIRHHLHFKSWHAVEGVAHRDYWFFGPEHVVPYDRYAAAASAAASNRGYHVVTGAPWGLYVVKWSNQYLEYTTRLRAGRYHLFLDVYAPQLRELSKTRFSIVRSPTATQYFTSSPPLRWLERQMQCMVSPPPSRPTSQPASASCSSTDLHTTLHSTQSYSHSHSFDPTKLYVGVLEVGPSDVSKWADVTLRIESLDWSEPLAGLVFNYLYFEAHPSKSSVALDWVVQPSEPCSGPTYALSMIYKRANERKRRWSLNQQEREEHSDEFTSDSLNEPFNELIDEPVYEPTIE